MSNTVIKVENLSKQYRLGEVGTGTISHDINRWWAKVRGKEDPFLKIGETNDRTSKGSSDYVWALKDINFDIQQGDAVGIIGRNGAGKSTLLKILSKTTTPNTGSIKIKGRIASLLEVGTGFHPEMTGRENIFLNGAILGMRKKEIARKFDEIVDFAGVERYIDTPVKRYSSGMYVRLAFAVAAHLESEILIVDEVLAVGDAEFQKKCLGKMGEVSKGEGRTVLFVSHNMGSISTLCNKGIVLKNGCTDFLGDVNNSIKHYLQQGNEHSFKPIKHPKLDLLNFYTNQKSYTLKEDIIISLEINVHEDINYMQSVIHLWNDMNIHILSSADIDSQTIVKREKGKHQFNVIIPKELLAPGNYLLKVAFGIPNMELFYETDGPKFEITDIDSYAANWSRARRDVIISTNLKWENK